MPFLSNKTGRALHLWGIGLVLLPGSHAEVTDEQAALFEGHPHVEVHATAPVAEIPSPPVVPAPPTETDTPSTQAASKESD